MLSLQLKSGEYLTIGSDIAVQVFEHTPSTFRVAVKAPRELPILRGELLERTEERPEGLLKKAGKSPSERARDAKRAQMLEERQAERRRRTDEQEAVTRELLNILSRVDEFAEAHSGLSGIQGELKALRSRLDSISEQ